MPIQKEEKLRSWPWKMRLTKIMESEHQSWRRKMAAATNGARAAASDLHGDGAGA